MCSYGWFFVSAGEVRERAVKGRQVMNALKKVMQRSKSLWMKKGICVLREVEKI